MPTALFHQFQCIYVGPHIGTRLVLQVDTTFCTVLELGCFCPHCGTLLVWGTQFLN